jgi:peptide/nickel transport system ATP-binding protein
MSAGVPLSEASHPLIEVRNVSVAFGATRAVEGASLAVKAGTTLGIVGESGSGKTTISRVMLGLVTPTEGRVIYDGRDIATFRRSDRLWFRRHAQMIFQDPASSLSPRLTIRRALEEPLRIHGLPVGQYRGRLDELLATVGLRDAQLDKYPHQLSGGQARRVGIARALILEPRLVVADEPTAGLDVSIQGDLLNLMGELQRRLGLTYVMVSHNLNVIRTATDEVAVMYLGKLVEIGATGRVFERPGHPYTRALLGANPQIDPERKRPKEILQGEVPTARPSGCHFRTRCRFAQARCATEEPQLTSQPDGRVLACHFPLGQAAEEPVRAERA